MRCRTCVRNTKPAMHFTDATAPRGVECATCVSPAACTCAHRRLHAGRGAACTACASQVRVAHESFSAGAWRKRSQPHAVEDDTRKRRTVDVRSAWTPTARPEGCFRAPHPAVCVPVRTGGPLPPLERQEAKWRQSDVEFHFFLCCKTCGKEGFRTLIPVPNTILSTRIRVISRDKQTE